MRYFSLEAKPETLPSMRQNIPGEDNESVALLKEYEALETRLLEKFRKQGLVARHQYMWPDGSLYLYACGVKEPDIEECFVTEISGEQDPFKCGHKTVQSYLAAYTEESDES